MAVTGDTRSKYFRSMNGSTNRNRVHAKGHEAGSRCHTIAHTQYSVYHLRQKSCEYKETELPVKIRFYTIPYLWHGGKRQVRNDQMAEHHQEKSNHQTRCY